MSLLSLVDRAIVEEVGVRVVAVDFEDFGDEAAARAALDVNDDIERVADVGLDGAVRKLNAALQHATREASEALLGRIGVNGGKRARVAGIQKLQKIERFAASNFAEQNAVRAMAKSGFQQVADGDGRKRRSVPCRASKRTRFVWSS